jgi:hypothetical protein
MKIGQIIIVSGEGEGTEDEELYHGKGSFRALKMRLKKESCGGDRWAKAMRYEYKNEYGEQFSELNIETESWEMP